MLDWLVDHKVARHIPAIDKAGCTDGICAAPILNGQGTNAEIKASVHILLLPNFKKAPAQLKLTTWAANVCLVAISHSSKAPYDGAFTKILIWDFSEDNRSPPSAAMSSISILLVTRFAA